MFNKFYKFIITFILLTSLVACNNTAEPTFNAKTKTFKKEEVVRFWGEEYSKYNELFDRYNEETSYNIEQINNGENNLSVAINSGAAPDVAFIKMNDVIKLSSDNILRPLDDFIDLDEELAIDDFYKFYMDIGKYQNKHYSFPWDIEYSVFFWNKNLFEDAGLDPDTPPKDWDQILDYAKLLTNFNSKGEIVQLGYITPDEIKFYLNTLLIANQGSIVSEDGKRSTVNSSEVVETLSFVLDLINTYKESKLADEQIFDFKNNNVAMTIVNMKESSNIAYDNTKNVGVSVPPPPEGKSPLTTGWAKLALVLPKESNNPQGGYEFAKWMVTEGNYDIMKTKIEENPKNLSGMLSPHIVLNQQLDLLVTNNCKNNYILEQYHAEKEVFENYIKVFPNTPIKVNLKFDQLWDALVKGEKTIKDTVVEWDTYNRNILDSYYNNNLGIANK